MSNGLRKFIAIVVAVLLLTYVGYQVYIINKDEIETETATYASVSDTLQTTGFVIRNELPIDTPYSGVLSYTVADGERVSSGETIADIYQSEKDANAQGRIQRIDNEIELLKSLTNSEEFFITNPELINAQIYESLDGIQGSIKNGDFSELSSKREDFQVALSRKNIITGIEAEEDYVNRISSLEAEKEEILNSAGGRIDFIKSPAAGYFISSTDGFEKETNFDEIDKITVNDVNNLLEKADSPRESTSTIGKICTEFNWYITCVLSKDDMIRLEDASKVNIEVPFATTEKIPATIVSRNLDQETGDTAVVLRCGYMNNDIAKIRKELVRIEIKTYSGVLVNEKSIRFNNIEKIVENEDGSTEKKTFENVKGVYVKRGDRIEFVQIFSERTLNGYAICKTELAESDIERLVTDSTISLYDEILVGGIDLYDGKIIS